MNIKRTMLVLACIITLALCGTVSAADTTSITDNSSNSSVHSLQSSTSVNNTSSQPPDPIISGVIKDNSTNKGLGNVTIRVLQNNTQVAQTTTNNDGTYSLNFTNSNTNFIIIASKLGYMPISRSITVMPSSNLSDPNLYGTADFRLYKLLKYSGNASSYVLNIGALPQILLDIYAGKSSAWVDSNSTTYSNGGGTSLEIKLLTFSLLSGLLDVYSTGNDGYKAGGLLPANNSTLNKVLKDLGLDISLLSAYSNSSADMPSASGTGNLASLNLDIKLLDLIKILGLNVGAVGSSSSVIPDFNTGVLVSTSSAGVANITVTLLGEKLLEIEAFQTVATASVNGKPGGAHITFDGKPASIKLRGVIVNSTRLEAGISIPGILTLSLGSTENTTSPDGTYAKVSGDALRLQILDILGGGLVNLVIGHVEAEAQVPVGGLHVNTSDLEVTKTVNNTHPNYLQNITYILKVHNNGPDAAAGVTVTDKLPSGLKFLSASGDGTYDPTTGTWTIGTLANGTDAVLQIVAQVIASNTSITNIAGVNGSNYDPNPGNDQSNTTITVDPASDLIINKIVDNSHPKYLQNVTYTLTAHNNGPDNATGVIVLDKLPAGLKFISASGNGTYDSTTGTWTIGTLANGENAILQIVAQIITSNTQITNIARINGTNYDQNTTNNESNTTITVDPASDLGITKTVNNSKPNYLDNVIFTLTAHNYGPDTATGIIVLDKLPNGLKFISSNGNYDQTTGIWTVGNLANGEKAILNIIAQVIASNTQITNIASINGTNYDQNTTNNQSNTTINVSSASDLGITKTVNNSHPNYLQNVTFTIKVHNYGPDTATGVTIIDKLPAGLKFLSSNGSYDPTTGIWTVGTLVSGEEATLSIITQVIASNTQITNIANVTGSNYDQNSTNDKSNTTITVDPASDLEVTKTVNNTHPNYLQNVTYAIKVHNNGPDTATGVIVLDKLPIGLKFISSNGNYDATTGTWTIGNLADGQEAVLNIIAQVIASNTQITNIAGVNGTNYDQNSTNNESNTTINVSSASDLGITKIVDKKTANYLDKIYYTITVTNHGPDQANNITVSDYLPTGLQWISDNSNGAYNHVTGVWTIDAISNGGSITLNILAQIIKSNTLITNVATVNNNTYDQNSTNNQDQTTTTVSSASDLNISKTVNNTHPKYLENVTFTITAHNNGPDTATGVIVLDKLPAGLTWISDDSKGIYNPTTGIWTIGTLANGESAVLKIIAQITASNTQITNIASINGTNYDQNSTNNESNSTVTVNPASDLGITKTVNNTHPNYLQNVTFTIKVHNYGPDNATSVTVTDKLPSGLKFISSDDNYDSTTGIWTIGTLANDEEAVLNIIAQVIASNTQITNIAGVKGTNYDQNPSNNQSNATIIVDAASDLTITKTVDNTHPNYLQNIIYTLKVRNNGPDAATGVTAIDKLPTGLKFISSDGNYNSTTGIWTIGTLTNGQEVVLNIIAQVITSNTQITNIAEVNGTNYDQNSTNNQSNTTINVGLASDLGITKTVNNAKPNYLQNVRFTLTAHNYGPDNATGVTVTDKLPTGLKFISVSGDGIYDSTTGVWTIGNLTNGATAVLNIIAQAVSANTQVINTASITGINYDQNSTNDQSSATVNIKPASDLGIKITADNAHPAYKDYVTFTLTATNAGPNDAAYVKVYNTLPDKLKYISDDSNGAFNSTTGLWTIGYLATGETAVLHIVAQAMTSNVILTDVARITDPDPVGATDFYDPNQDNDQSSVTVGVDPVVDLSITKTVNNSKPNYLQNVKFTLTAHNNGPDNATGVTVLDKLPADLKFLSVSGNGSYDSKTGTWTIGSLANGTTAVLNIIAQVIASDTQIINTASITGHEFDLNTSNNNANAAVNVDPASDLGITKTVDNKRPKYLQKVTFTLTAHNYGPNSTTYATVIDKLPSGLKFVSTDGNYNPTTGIWTITNLTNGKTAVLHIVAQATTPSKVLTNIATINGTNYDQNSANNKGSASVTVGPAADLAVKMSVSNAHPKYKQKVTFTITAYNYGPMDAKNVTVTLKMPKGFKYVSKDRNIQYDSKTGVWTIGNLKNGGKLVLHIVEQAVTSNVRLTSTAVIKGTAIIK